MPILSPDELKLKAKARLRIRQRGGMDTDRISPELRQGPTGFAATPLARNLFGLLAPAVEVGAGLATAGVVAAKGRRPEAALTADVAGQVAAKQFITRPIAEALKYTKPLTAKERALTVPVDMATATSASLLGVGGQKLTQKLFAPFQKSIRPSPQKLFKEADIEPPPSAISSSETVKQAEALVRKGPFGEGLRKQTEEAENKILGTVKKTFEMTESEGNVVRAGEIFSDAVNEVKSQFIRQKNKMYDASKVVESIPVNDDEIKPVWEYVDDLIAQATRSEKTSPARTGISQLKKLRDKLTRPPEKIPSKILDASGRSTFQVVERPRVSVQDLTDALRTQNEQLKFPPGSLILTGSRAKLAKLNAAMDEARDKAFARANPGEFEAFQKANNFYSDSISALNSEMGKRLSKKVAQKQYDQVVSVFLQKNTSSNDAAAFITQIKKTHLAEVNEIQAGIMGHIVNKATKKIGDRIVIDPNKLNTLMGNIGTDKLESILTAEQLSALRGAEEMSRAILEGSASARGSQTAFLVRLAGLFMSVFSGDAKLALKSLGQEGAAAALVSSVPGQKFVTEGLFTPKTRHVLSKLVEFPIRFGVASAAEPDVAPLRLRDLKSSGLAR